MATSATGPATGEGARLDSWKQIAAYLGRGERTVRRWEQTEGLPVHRHLHQQRGSVWAYESELDGWMAGRQTSPSASKRWRLWAGLAFAVVALAVVVFFVRWPLGAVLPSLLPEALPLTAYPGKENGAAFSPDGKKVVFFWSGPTDGLAGLYIKAIGSETPAPLLTSRNMLYSPAWSPDGKQIAFLRRDRQTGETTLGVISPSGENERRLATLGLTLYMQHTHLSWTPDSRWVLAPAATDGALPGIHLVSAENGAMRRLTEPTEPDQKDYTPALSPDGRTLAFMRQSHHFDELTFRISVVDLTPDWRVATEPRTLLAGKLFPFGPSGMAWEPSGEALILCTGNTLTVTPLACQLWRVPLRAGSQPSPLGVNECFNVAVSRPDSSGAAMLAYGRLREQAHLWRASLSSVDDAVQIAPSTRSEILPDFSPDGRVIAFLSDRSGLAEIWVADPDGKNPRALTSLKASIASGPRWSPDGSLIVFSAGFADEPRQVYVIPASGGAPRRLISGHDPSWSHDGRWIYYTSYSSTMQIWRMRADGTGPVQITRSGASIARESADGRNVIYSRWGPPHSLWTVPVEGGTERLIDDNLGLISAFTVTSRGIYFVQTAGPKALLHFLPQPGSTPRRIGILPPLSNLGLAISPDESVLVYARSDPEDVDLQLIKGFR